MIKFEVGQRFVVRCVADYNTKTEFLVLKRTAKTVTIEETFTGEVFLRKVDSLVNAGCETIYPAKGLYSMKASEPFENDMETEADEEEVTLTMDVEIETPNRSKESNIVKFNVGQVYSSFGLGDYMMSYEVVKRTAKTISIKRLTRGDIKSGDVTTHRVTKAAIGDKEAINAGYGAWIYADDKDRSDYDNNIDRDRLTNVTPISPDLKYYKGVWLDPSVEF